jgi:hypothetical protein
MDNDLNPHANNEENQIIQEAMRRAQEDIKRRESLEELTRQEAVLEDPEIPEELDASGTHPLSEMSTLARVGKDTSSFELNGNDITIRTLPQKEELEILSRLKHFPPDAKQAAYATFCAACCIESVNGKPYFDRMPIGPKDDMYLYKFQQFLELYPLSINVISAEYHRLKSANTKKAQYAKKG